MISILILADSGFGKSTSLLPIPEIGHIGLNPEETFIVSATSKPLPVKGANTLYPITVPEKLKDGRRVITNSGKTIAAILKTLKDSPFKNIVIEDLNYVMQDYYMAKAMTGGWDR
jgi:hypothetical protein